jgi:hypothetical protein
MNHFDASNVSNSREKASLKSLGKTDRASRTYVCIHQPLCRPLEYRVGASERETSQRESECTNRAHGSVFRADQSQVEAVLLYAWPERRFRRSLVLRLFNRELTQTSSALFPIVQSIQGRTLDTTLNRCSAGLPPTP